MFATLFSVIHTSILFLVHSKNLISCLFQTSASFFSELTNSISSVQTGIEKFLSDATVDLKDTIDCTIYAVQQVFSDDGILQGYQKCQENNNMITLPPPSHPIHHYVTPIVAGTSTDDARIMNPKDREQNILKSTTNATNTKNDDQIEKKQSVESYLMNMNSKLEHEFKDLSKNVKDDLIKIENEQKQLPMKKVMKEIVKLLEEKISYKSNMDSEIHTISDKTLTKLDNNDTDNNFDFKDKIKTVITQLDQKKNQTNVEQELKMLKEKELESLIYIRKLLKKSNKIDTLKVDDTSSDMSNNTSTKTVPSPVIVSSIRKSTTTPIHTPSRDIGTNAPVVDTSTPASHTTKKSTEASLIKSDNSDSKDKSTLDLLKLFSNSKKTASIMANIVKHRKSASNVFDRPELFSS